MQKISVIIPVYNTDKYLAKCLDSVITQTFSDIEIICINDGSTDNSAEILKKYAEKDSRIKIITQTNKGPSAVRNRGIDEAKGEYISFIDSDDTIDKNYYKVLVDLMKKNNADIAMAGMRKVNKDKISENTTPNCVTNNLREKISYLPNGSCCDKLFKINLFKDNKITFPVGRLFEDNIVLLQLMFFSDNVAFTNTVSYYYFANPNGTCHTQDKKIIKKKRKDKKWIANEMVKFAKANKFDSSCKKEVITFVRRAFLPKYKVSILSKIKRFFFRIENNKIKIFKIPVLKMKAPCIPDPRLIMDNNISYIPKVSVIIPVYNTEKYLRKCLNSVINQTLEEIEIICVDDGSTDNSLKILKEYAKKDNRIKVVKQNNSNAGVARNSGLNISNGEYVFFLDSDDWIDESCLLKSYTKAQKSKSDIVIFAYDQYDDRNKKITFKQSIAEKYLTDFSPSAYKDDLFTITNPAAWTKLFRTKLIKDNNICFNSCKTCNDLSFTYIAMICSEKISCLQDVLIHYRTNQTMNLSSGTNRGKHTHCLITSVNTLYKNMVKKRVFLIYYKCFIQLLQNCIKYEKSFKIKTGMRLRLKLFLIKFKIKYFMQKYFIAKREL